MAQKQIKPESQPSNAPKCTHEGCNLPAAMRDTFCTSHAYFRDHAKRMAEEGAEHRAEKK